MKFGFTLCNLDPHFVKSDPHYVNLDPDWSSQETAYPETIYFQKVLAIILGTQYKINVHNFLGHTVAIVVMRNVMVDIRILIKFYNIS